MRDKFVITDHPIEPLPPTYLWFYRHNRKLGVKEMPDSEGAYYLGQYWLREARRRNPEGKYRFAIGQPVYVVEWKSGRVKKSIHRVALPNLEEAQEKVKEWSTNKGQAHYIEIKVGYEWTWHSLK